VAVDFKNVNATGIDFSKAFLIASDFRAAKLQSADFSNAWLRNVRFQNANLDDAKFAGADWFNAAGLTMDQMQTIEPKGLKQCPRGADGKYSKLQFVAFANSNYGVPFDGWNDEEQEDASKYWAIYVQKNGLCDFIKSLHH